MWDVKSTIRTIVVSASAIHTYIPWLWNYMKKIQVLDKSEPPPSSTSMSYHSMIMEVQHQYQTWAAGWNTMNNILVRKQTNFPHIGECHTNICGPIKSMLSGKELAGRMQKKLHNDLLKKRWHLNYQCWPPMTLNIIEYNFVDFSWYLFDNLVNICSPIVKGKQDKQTKWYKEYLRSMLDTQQQLSIYDYNCNLFCLAVA